MIPRPVDATTWKPRPCWDPEKCPFPGPALLVVVVRHNLPQPRTRNRTKMAFTNNVPLPPRPKIKGSWIPLNILEMIDPNNNNLRLMTIPPKYRHKRRPPEDNLDPMALIPMSIWNPSLNSFLATGRNHPDIMPLRNIPKPINDWNGPIRE